jgi:hypothetical protein
MTNLVHLSKKGNDKEDYFNYLHIVERDSASLEDLFLGLERLSLRRNKRDLGRWKKRPGERGSYVR